MSNPHQSQDTTSSPPKDQPRPPVYPADASWAGVENSPRYTTAAAPTGDPATAGYPTGNPSAPLPYPQPGPFPAQQYLSPYPSYPIVVPAPRPNGLAVAGFVTGLLGLIFFWVPGLGLILGSLGIILGGVAMSASRKAGSSNGLAIAGLVLGIISLIPAILVLTALSNTGI